ncbi:MAG: MOSC domain-containing protein [Cohaesibacteraceae bacterium]|nr:MOSC domain-containing protein [Cohaesibacteraceae bacterium]
MKIKEINRYPVKGLSADSLQETPIKTGAQINRDRAFAIENGESPFDPNRPAHLPKIHFLMLMKQERLAALTSRFDDSSHILTIEFEGETVARGNPTVEADRKALQLFFENYCSKEKRGDLKFLHAPGHMFSDSRTPSLSLINLASVRALETAIGITLDPMRFRGNVLYDGGLPFEEFSWINRSITIGTCNYYVRKRIVRCAATNVNPDTAVRDCDIPKSLRDHFGHADLGVYIVPQSDGWLRIGDLITVGS